MIQILDKEYINKISYKLEKFKWKNNNLSTCRCPICGDSAKKQSKTRGYFYLKNDHYNYMCHNCGASLTFQNFLRDFDQESYKQYIIDRFKNDSKQSKNTGINKSPKIETVFGDKYGMVHVSDLAYNHPSRTYLRNRQIPSNDVYHVDNFFSWGSKHFPTKFKEVYLDHPRIIFPAYDENRNIIGYSCRSINGEEPKYYTLKFVEDFVFGLNRIDKSKPVYVVEGGIDSLFLDNCVAVCTSALHTVKRLDDCRKILVPDNQCRNREIIKLVGKFIDLGFEVVIWPDNLEQFKDVNDFIMGGYSRTKLMELIGANTYKGFEAKLRYNNWRKV